MAEYGETLTDREMEVLELVSTGITNREVAQELFISINTVKVHLRNVYTKLGADSRTEATMIAVREGWVSVGEEEKEIDEQEVEESEEEIAPRPPLPWPKRIALVAALLVAAFGVIVTWPRSGSQAANGPDLPLEQSSTQAMAPQTDGDEESPWNERAQMPTRRAYMALAPVDGQIMAIGGQTPGGVTDIVEAYDVENDTWTTKSSKPTPGVYIEAATIGKEVYVPGGCDGEGRPTRVVEVYDAEENTWHETSPLPEPRGAYALATWEEKLYLFGGWDGERYVATTYVYDPQAEAWAEVAPMSTPRGFAGAALLGERLYVVGGYDGERELTTCAAYDPASDTWSDCAPLAVGRGGLGLANVGGRLYAIGGGGRSSYLGFNERYDPAEDVWSAVETPLVGEWRPGVVVFDATIYAIGGWSSDYLGLNLAYELLPFRIFIPVSHQ